MPVWRLLLPKCIILLLHAVSCWLFRTEVFLYGFIDVSKIKKCSNEEKRTMNLFDISSVISCLEGSTLFFWTSIAEQSVLNVAAFRKPTLFSNIFVPSKILSHSCPRF